MMIKAKIRTTAAVELYRNLRPPKDQVYMPQLRGNPAARALLIAPPCTEAEYKAGVPFCDASTGAERFHDILLASTNLDTQKHFLVVTCSFYGEKPSKQSTDMIREYVEECAQQGLFKLYVCLGSTAFKYLFGGGRKMAASTLYGTVLRVPQVNHQPLVILPDVDTLIPKEVPGNDWMTHRSHRYAEDMERRIAKLCLKLAQYYPKQ